MSRGGYGEELRRAAACSSYSASLAPLEVPSGIISPGGLGLPGTCTNDPFKYPVGVIQLHYASWVVSKLRLLRWHGFDTVKIQSQLCSPVASLLFMYWLRRAPSPGSQGKLLQVLCYIIKQSFQFDSSFFPTFKCKLEFWIKKWWHWRLYKDLQLSLKDDCSESRLYLPVNLSCCS